MTPRGRPNTLREPYRSLAEAFGGVGKLALALGVNRRTIHSWSTGTRQPGGPARKLLAQLIKP